jgi:hypothetical protein
MKPTAHKITVANAYGDSLTLRFTGGDESENEALTVQAFRAANAVTQADGEACVPEYSVKVERS